MSKKLNEVQIQEIRRLRYINKWSYGKIADEFNVSKQSVRYHLLKDSKRDVLIRSNKTKKKPQRMLKSIREYDFLKNIKAVFKWAVDNYNIPKSEIEVLLYLYSFGGFNREDFMKFKKSFGDKKSWSFNKFIENNFITLWRRKTENYKAVYTLTNKGKRLCSDMHSFLAGDKELPKTNKSKDKGYLEIIKRLS